MLLAAALALAAIGCSEPTESERLADAQSRLANGDRAAALVELRSVVQAFPASGAARLLLGRLLLQAHDPAAAEVELTRALQSGQAPDDVLPLLAQALLGQGKSQPLLTLYGQARLTRDESAAALHTMIAEAHAIQGRLDLARRQVDEALRRLPRSPEARLLLARLTAQEGDPAGALRAVEALTVTDPGHADAWMLKAELLQAGGAASATVEAALRQALAAAPDASAAHGRLILLKLQQRDWAGAVEQHRAMAKALPRHARTTYFEALLAQQQGEAAKARELGQTLVKRLPEEPAVLVLAARSELAAGAAGQAEAMLSKALRAAPAADEVRLLLGRSQLQAGKAERALATLQPLVSKPTAGWEALLLESAAWLQRGDTAAADRALQRAARAAPDHPRVRLAQAVRKADTGAGVDAALNELRQLAERDGIGNDAAAAEIALRLSRRDTAGALSALTAVSARQPALAWPHDLRGRIEWQRGDLPAARAAFEEAQRRQPDLFAPVAMLTEIDLKEHRHPAAVQRLEAFVRAHPKHLQAKIVHLQVRQRVGGLPATEAAAGLQALVQAHPLEAPAHRLLADHWLAAGDARQSLAAAQAGLALLPDHLELLERLAQAQELGGDAVQAMTTWRRWAELQPQSVPAMLRLAEQHLRQAQPEGARLAIQRARELDPRDLSAQRAAFAMMLREGKPAEGLAIALAVQAQHPQQAVGWLLQGDAEAAQKRWPAAQSAYRRAWEKAPQAVEPPARLHGALLAAGRAAEADQVAAEWRRRRPDDAAFAYALAAAALARENWVDAEARYRELLARRAEDPVVLNNLSMALLRQRKEEALPLAERAAALAPSSAAVIDTLAQALAEAQQPVKALQAQRRAVALAPHAPGLRLRLARLHLQLGQPQAARDELVRLSQVRAPFAERQEVTRLLAEIKPISAAVPAAEFNPAAVAVPAAAAPAARRPWWRVWAARTSTVAAAAALAFGALLTWLLASALRSAQLRVECRKVLPNAPREVFMALQDLRGWPRWMPLPAFEAGTRCTFVDSPDGHAGSCRWTREGRPRAEGYLDTVQSLPDSRLVVEAHTVKPTPSVQVLAFVLQPSGEGGTALDVMLRGNADFRQRLRALGLDPARRIRRRLDQALETFAASLAVVPRPLPGAAAPDPGSAGNVPALPAAGPADAEAPLADPSSVATAVAAPAASQLPSPAAEPAPRAGSPGVSDPSGSGAVTTFPPADGLEQRQSAAAPSDPTSRLSDTPPEPLPSTGRSKGRPRRSRAAAPAGAAGGASPEAEGRTPDGSAPASDSPNASSSLKQTPAARRKPRRG